MTRDTLCYRRWEIAGENPDDGERNKIDAEILFSTGTDNNDYIICTLKLTTLGKINEIIYSRVTMEEIVIK